MELQCLQFFEGPTSPGFKMRLVARQDLGSYAVASALDELYGLGYQFSDTEDAKYESVTLEQVQATAQKYLRPEALVVALVKPDNP